LYRGFVPGSKIGDPVRFSRPGTGNGAEVADAILIMTPAHFDLCRFRMPQRRTLLTST